MLVNDPRSVTFNANIMKFQLCCSVLDFRNKPQSQNECVFCHNNSQKCMLSVVSRVGHQPELSSNTAMAFAVTATCFWFLILLFWWLSVWPGHLVIVVANVPLMWPLMIPGTLCSHQLSSWTFWDLLLGKVFHLLRFKQWLSTCFTAFHDTQVHEKPFSKVLGSSTLWWNRNEEVSLVEEPWWPRVNYRHLVG